MVQGPRAVGKKSIRLSRLLNSEDYNAGYEVDDRKIASTRVSRTQARSP